jgi:hypothetical protein
MTRFESPSTESGKPRPPARLTRARRRLPWLAGAGMAVALAALAFVASERERATIATGATKAAAAAVLDGIVAMHPPAIEDPGFLAFVERASRVAPVSGAWCFASDGRLVWAQGSTAMSTPVGRLANELATDEGRRLAETLERDWPSREARLAVLAASAIAAEGEHNDIYRHMLRAVHGPDGRLAGFVGLLYDAGATRGRPSGAYLSALALLLVGLGVYWVALPVWVLLDAQERGERALVWAAFTGIGNLVALAAYLLTRRSRPAPEA